MLPNIESKSLLHMMSKMHYLIEYGGYCDKLVMAGPGDNESHCPIKYLECLWSADQDTGCSINDQDRYHHVLHQADPGQSTNSWTIS